MLSVLERSALRSFMRHGVARYSTDAVPPQNASSSSSSEPSKPSTPFEPSASESSEPSSTSSDVPESAFFDAPSEASQSKPSFWSELHASASASNSASEWKSDNISIDPLAFDAPDPFDEPAVPTRPPASTESVDALWDRVLRTPLSVVSKNPQDVRPGLKSLLEKATASPRMPKYERVERALRPEFGRERDRERGRDSRERPTSGAAFRAHRAGGQTRSEAGRINDALAQMFQQLEDRMLRPSQGGSLGDLLRLPHTEARREDEDAAVVAAADALAATLSGITSAADVIPWAEANVFARAEGPDTRAGFPRTYPRMLAAVMRHLRALGAPHLALAMFAHARELGLESYLAGCLTSAYNELIRTRWDAFRDLGGVVAAVADMEATAVAWDRSTNIAVTGVVGAVSKDILASTEHRWGADAYVQLAALERSIDTDTQREAAIFERKQMDRREERRRRSHAPTHLYQRETPSPF